MKLNLPQTTPTTGNHTKTKAARSRVDELREKIRAHINAERAAHNQQSLEETALRSLPANYTLGGLSLTDLLKETPRTFDETANGTPWAIWWELAHFAFKHCPLWAIKEVWSHARASYKGWDDPHDGRIYLLLDTAILPNNPDIIDYLLNNTLNGTPLSPEKLREKATSATQHLASVEALLRHAIKCANESNPAQPHFIFECRNKNTGVPENVDGYQALLFQLGAYGDPTFYEQAPEKNTSFKALAEKSAQLTRWKKEAGQFPHQDILDYGTNILLAPLDDDYYKILDVLRLDFPFPGWNAYAAAYTLKVLFGTAENFLATLDKFPRTSVKENRPWAFVTVAGDNHVMFQRFAEKPDPVFWRRWGHVAEHMGPTVLNDLCIDTQGQDPTSEDLLKKAEDVIEKQALKKRSWRKSQDPS